MKLSVILASYNRSHSLLRFLEAISHQVVPEGVEWEVLIVDNNSDDGTRSLISPLVEAHPQRFKYLLEIRQGKSLALNAGVRAASGQVLVFTDDDCVPDPHWLASIAEEFAAKNPIDALGGRVELYDPSHQPFTILTGKERVAIVSAGQLLIRPQIFGCNMAFRRSVFDAVGEFDPLLGPGARLGAAEDADFLYRIHRQGFTMFYSPDVLVYHNHGRTTDAEIDALMRGYYIGRGALYFKHAFSGDTKALKIAYWDVKSGLRDVMTPPLSFKSVKKELAYLSALAIGVARMCLGESLSKISRTQRNVVSPRKGK
jgi:glycosyltransferase involved in cell wall biosynthesis